jgi:hypothetical protein
MDDNEDWLEIPAFLDRKLNPLPPAPGGLRKDVASMVARQDDTVAEEAVVEAPTPARTKATRKASNGAVTPKPAKAKATGKAAKPAKAAKAKAAKPAKAEKVELDKFGYRKGSLRSQAAALYSTGKGATLGEVKEKLGSVQLNVLTELEGKGYKVTKTKEAGDGPRQVTRYHLKSK